MPDYPDWFYYPPSQRPPAWVAEFIGVVSKFRQSIDSARVRGLNSDRVLAVLSSKLTESGFIVESGKKKADKIRRPVLFGDRGQERVAYEVDGFHEEFGIVLEVEAGRGARGNAVYRDLVRSSLIFDAQYLAIGVMREYHHKNQGRDTIVHSYDDAKDALDALYASGRLQLPFRGVLLFGD